MSVMYVAIPKRRRWGLTDYRSRRATIRGSALLLTPSFSCENVSVKIVKPTLKGDLTLSSTNSRELLKYGWKGSRKNAPASYLVGLLTGLKAKKEGIEKVILYTGVRQFIKGSRMGAIVRGVIEAGIEIPFEDVTPSDESRVSGEHIGAYAKVLIEEKGVYRAKFSRLIRNGLKPEEYPEHFDEVKVKILRAFNVVHE